MKKLIQTLAIACCMIAIVIGSMTSSVAQSPLWGQCGGEGWTGSLVCAAGATCTVVNPFYSQCMPGTGDGGGGGCPSRCSGGGCGSTSCTITAPTIPGVGGGGASKSVTAGSGYFACCYSTGVTLYAQTYPNSCCN